MCESTRIKKLLTKKDRHYVLYFPNKLVQLKEDTYDLLVELDGNYSQWMHIILPLLNEALKKVERDGKKLTDFEWVLTIK